MCRSKVAAFATGAVSLIALAWFGPAPRPSPEPTLRPETIAGKRAFAVVRATADLLYLYPIGEVLFSVGATPADLPSTEADAQAALAALP